MNRREALSALMSLPAVKTISVARLEPTDVIVLETDRMLSDEMVSRIEAHAKTLWPNQKVAVLCDGMTMKVVKGTA